MRSDGFLASLGSGFLVQPVTIIHDAGQPNESRDGADAVIDGAKGIFDIDAPVDEGDWVEVSDNRRGSGKRRLYVDRVDMFPGGHLEHLEAHWGRRPSAGPSAVTHTYNAPVVTVQGDNAQVAWGDGSIAQSHHGDQQVTAGYENLAAAVAEALQLLTAQLSEPNDRADAKDAAESVLAEVVKDNPEPTLVRRGLTALRGLLAPIAIQTATAVGGVVATGSAAAAQDLIHRLTIGG